MQEQPSFIDERQADNFDIRELTEKYIIHWKWFVMGVIACLMFAALYIRYQIPVYSATATILVKDDKKGGLQSELAAFSDLGVMSGVKSNVDNEIEVIKSRNIIRKTIKKLGFTVTYITEGRVKTLEEYKDKPIEFAFYNLSDSFYDHQKSFAVNSVDAKKFELFSIDREQNQKSMGVFSYGAILNLDDSKLVVTKNPRIASNPHKFSILVNVNRLENVVDSYRGRLSVAPLSKNSSVVALTINDPVREKAEDFLNILIETYNEDAIADKKFISENTLSFIQDRLKIITGELGDVEKNAEEFKKSNKVTDIQSQGELYLRNSVEADRAIIESETQLSVIASMIDFMRTKGKWDLIPSNILAIDAEEVSSYILQYNESVLQRNKLIKDGTPKNLVIQNLERRIEELNANIESSLQRTQVSLKIRRSELEKQSNRMSGKISQIPSQEREFRIIDRQQKIKETLYLYLLQKREETAISLAVTSPISKIVDAAFSSGSPVSPKRNIIYLIAIALGLFIPLSVIFILDILDNKIKSRHDIEGKLSAPVLGDIPKSTTPEELIDAKSRSASAEAVRIVRTNLEFMLAKIPEGQSKTIFITSSVPKEGKTFVSVNLASTIALSGKKVLLVGLDIRNPKIDKYVKLPSKGITNYLSKSNVDIKDYIVKLDNFDQFYVLPSGIIPPNPVDLLMNNKVNTLFDELKKDYEYIIVDTAPVSIVTDTLLIAKNADAFIYVVRANYLDKRFVKLIEMFYKENKLPNMSILINDTVMRKTYGYGYSYGYGYGYYGYGTQEAEKQPWYKTFFKK
jgi:tyrosine-protein kinase Etk/Wzc